MTAFEILEAVVWGHALGSALTLPLAIKRKKMLKDLTAQIKADTERMKVENDEAERRLEADQFYLDFLKQRNEELFANDPRYQAAKDALMQELEDIKRNGTS